MSSPLQRAVPDDRPRWLPLEAACNARDLAGLRTTDGLAVLPRALLRADTLEAVTPRDVALLTECCDLTTVIDLRSLDETRREGASALDAHPGVEVYHRPLLHRPPTERDRNSQVEELICPSGEGARSPYWRYLRERPDSIVAALGLIASARGAAMVNCAAGKDRTGVVVALALAEVGVTRSEMVDDYLASVARVPAVLARLKRSTSYGPSLTARSIDSYTPRSTYLTEVLDELDLRYGGVHRWLTGHGWCRDDRAALRAKLIGTEATERS